MRNAGGGRKSERGGSGEKPTKGGGTPGPGEKNGCLGRLSGKTSLRRRWRRLGKTRRNGGFLKRKGSKLGCKTGAARDMRQKGSNYRCCLPALAGFARPQSASPDGSHTMGRFLRNSTPPSGIFGYIPLASNRSSEECNERFGSGTGSFVAIVPIVPIVPLVPDGFPVSGLLGPRACSSVGCCGWRQALLTLPSTLPFGFPTFFVLPPVRVEFFLPSLSVIR